LGAGPKTLFLLVKIKICVTWKRKNEAQSSNPLRQYHAVQILPDLHKEQAKVLDRFPNQCYQRTRRISRVEQLIRGTGTRRLLLRPLTCSSRGRRHARRILPKTSASYEGDGMDSKEAAAGH
jgi:hypothetical protein